MSRLPSIDRLRERVYALRYRRGGLRRLARLASLSYSWTTKFACGRTRNERVETIARLRAALRRVEARSRG
jgi:hypothetical protein